jgi:hypothetical protein
MGTYGVKCAKLRRSESLPWGLRDRPLKLTVLLNEVVQRKLPAGCDPADVDNVLWLYFPGAERNVRGVTNGPIPLLWIALN